MNANSKITQSRPSQTKNSERNSCNQYQSVSLIPTPRQFARESPPYQLQIVASPIETRVKANQICNLIEPLSGVKLQTPLTYSEAVKILEKTRCWDFKPIEGRERCLSRLRSLINSVVAAGGDR